jgi:hypothetical protein
VIRENLDLGCPEEIKRGCDAMPQPLMNDALPVEQRDQRAGH